MTSGMRDRTESPERRIPKGGAAENKRERDRTERAAVRRVLGTITLDDDAVARDLRDTLQEETLRLPWIAHEHAVAGARCPARRDDEDPVPLPQRRLHAVAAHGHGPCAHYFLVAQNISPISLTAACRSVAACASTLCLFFDASFSAFQNESWSFGNF